MRLPTSDELRTKIKSLAGFRSSVVALSGQLGDAGHELTMMYIGNGINRSFISGAVFGDDLAGREISRCNIWRAATQAELHAASTDMIVMDVPWPYDITMPDHGNIVEIPAWVRQVTRLADTWEGTIANLRKSVRDSQLRKIRKFKLTEMTTRDPVAVDRFYVEMYKPHVKRRFGGAAHVESRQHIQACVSAGTLLSIVRDGEVIGACVLLHEGDTVQMLFIGFSGNDLREIDGASAGLYYYTLAYAFQNGYKAVDFCGSRPFLNDGVLAVKRRWGAGISDDWSMENLLIQVNNWNPGVESFLSDHPMITCQGDKLVGRVLVGDGELSAEFVSKVARQYVSPGIDGLMIYGLRGIRDDAFEAANSASVPVQLFDLRDADDP
ncbi:MAG: GNAT family N-acetyltransferase, partial [Gammaproteobacteria bacterium]|nr:GNAT family N-acetyltransferase [Gammaproteobacteria bacterium]